MGPSGTSAANLVVLGISAIVPVLTIWFVLRLLRSDGFGERLVAFARRCHLLPRARPVAAAPPVERLAADLRRLSAAAACVPRGISNARRRGVLAAYDDALVTACRALEVPQSLSTLPPGMDRELERLRVEASLESAGLRFRPLAR